MQSMRCLWAVLVTLLLTSPVLATVLTGPVVGVFGGTPSNVCIHTIPNLFASAASTPLRKAGLTAPKPRKQPQPWSLGKT